ASARMIGWMSALTTATLIGCVAVAAGFVWFNGAATGAGPLSESTTFKVTPRQGARAIARRLEQAGVIRSEQLFMARYMQHRASSWMNLRRAPILKAGTYEFSPGASVDSIMAELERGRGALKFITFPEGKTSHAIVARLNRDERLTGEVDVVPPEGILLPSTYDITPGMARAEVLQRMQEQQQAALEKLWAERAPNLPISTPEEAIILASIVQREMGPNDDPKRIASVFYNRLRRGMRLQSDPTILYGIFLGPVNWSKPILRSEIRRPTAHNTYQINGLPPTPICNPGIQAIEAVLRPAETEDLFFVADGKGGHFFSKTLAEHRARTREWRKIERAFRKREREEAARKARDARDAKTTATAAIAAPTVQNQNAAALRTTRTPSVTPPQTAPAALAQTVSTTPPPTTEATAGTIPLPVRKPRR
ncbi:MAG: endolytic transglycosylase MltG, partial [Pseudomonadota bacterium]